MFFFELFVTLDIWDLLYLFLDLEVLEGDPWALLFYSLDWRVLFYLAWLSMIVRTKFLSAGTGLS